MSLDIFQNIIPKELYEISKVAPNFYISGMIPITNKNYIQNLKKHSIEVIVSVIRNPIPILQKLDNIKYFHYTADDVESFDLSEHFIKVYDDIKPYIHKKNILVHCNEGKSRSTTMLMSILLQNFYNYKNIKNTKSDKLITDKLLKHIQNKRPLVQPNNGFMKQLRKFERSLQLI